MNDKIYCHEDKNPTCICHSYALAPDDYCPVHSMVPPDNKCVMCGKFFRKMTKRECTVLKKRGKHEHQTAQKAQET